MLQTKQMSVLQPLDPNVVSAYAPPQQLAAHPNHRHAHMQPAENQLVILANPNHHPLKEASHVALHSTNSLRSAQGPVPANYATSHAPTAMQTDGAAAQTALRALEQHNKVQTANRAPYAGCVDARNKATSLQTSLCQWGLPRKVVQVRSLAYPAT